MRPDLWKLTVADKFSFVIGHVEHGESGVGQGLEAFPVIRVEVALIHFLELSDIHKWSTVS